MLTLSWDVPLCARGPLSVVVNDPHARQSGLNCWPTQNHRFFEYIPSIPQSLGDVCWGICVWDETHTLMWIWKGSSTLDFTSFVCLHSVCSSERDAPLHSLDFYEIKRRTSYSERRGGKTESLGQRVIKASVCAHVWCLAVVWGCQKWAKSGKSYGRHDLEKWFINYLNICFYIKNVKSSFESFYLFIYF